MKTTATKTARAHVASYNKNLRAEQAKLRAEILALRPEWDAALLEQVVSIYGSSDAPGLWNILRSLQAVQALDARFAKVVAL